MFDTFNRAVVATLAQALLVCGLVSVSAFASDTPQNQSTEERLEQQERRIQELEERLRVMEAALRSGTFPEAEPPASAQTSDAAPENGESRPTVVAAAEDIPRGMQGSVNPLRMEKNYLTGDDLLDESFPGSWAIPGTGVRMAIRGYAKLDLIQDFDYVGDRYEFYLPSIAIKGTPEYYLDGQTTLHAKESRISFDFRKTVTRPNGDQYPLQAFLELDFFDDRETFALQPRMRHAYGVIGRLLAGQTWGTSADLTALAGMIDFSGGDAVYGSRVAQVRWADRLNPTTTWAIALEENKSEVGDPLGFDGRSRPTTPSLAGYLRWTQGKAHLGLGYDVFGIKWQGGETGPDVSAIGWGVSLTGRYLLGEKARDTISGQVTYGYGSAFKVVSLGGAGAGAVLDPNGDIETLRHWQAYAAYNHYWTDSLNSSFILAHAEVDTLYYQPDNQIEGASSAHVNLIWFPYKSVSTGVEVMWGERENKDGSTGDATRFQAMMKYVFN